MNQAFRFELSPNEGQRKALAQHIGAARFAYNWGLERSRKALEEGERLPSAAELHREWNRWKRENAPWWTEVSKCAPQEAFRDLEKALKNWQKRKSCFPRFKRKKLAPDNGARFTGAIKVFSRHIQLPRIGRVRSKEPTDKLLKLLEEGKAKILSATISREADRWYMSLTCEVERPDPKPKEVRSEDDVVGVDLGLSSFAVLSDGTRIEAPKPLAKRLRLLKRRSKQLSRKEKGSNKEKKAALRLARLHRKIKNLRRDFLHKQTTWLARTKPVIVVEDLNIKGLSRSPLSRSVADVGWGTFLRMLEYKANWYGATLIVAQRSFPSTRLCSRCGHLNGKMPLFQRVFRCEACSLERDRDLNAALNLRAYGLAHLTGPTASSAGSDAPGDSSGGGTALLGWSTSHGSLKGEAARRQPLGG
ncbi:transposase [Thermus aquaticus Y51MC23]|uniref:Transposase n=1 Tax=Thermus aquaticus (strain ATCC BAA-2747 / Y51MC23) TaxID=498848 RepID=A0ABM5VKQ1_THEA5|nr:transposase [Thermus aquaticus Y51MC23]